MSIRLTKEDIAEFEIKLGQLRLEHRDLDQVIDIMTQQGTFDQLQIRRLKKRRLLLKDEIRVMESLIIPDLDA